MNLILLVYAVELHALLQTVNMLQLEKKMVLFIFTWELQKGRLNIWIVVMVVINL